MKTNPSAPNSKGFHFPSEMISHAVWLYFRFSLSFRDIEELLAQRRIIVTDETVRQWCLKFGQSYANELLYWLRGTSVQKKATVKAIVRAFTRCRWTCNRGKI